MTIETTKMEAFLLCQRAARGDLGTTLVADAVANVAGVGTITDVSEFQDANQSTRDNQGLWVWRYELSDDDERSRIRTVAPGTGIATFTRAWVDELNLNYVLMGIDPRTVLDAMDTGYNRMTITRDLVMTLGGADLDMEDETEDFWNTDLLNATVVKEEALPEDKATGKRSLRITLTAGLGYVRSTPVRAVPGDILFVAPCLRVVTGGPFTLRLYDTTHGVYFGDTQEYSGAEFAFLFFKGNGNVVPDGCDFWQLEIKGTATSDVCILDSVTARAKDDVRFALPAVLDETYKVPLIHRMGFSRAIQGVEGQWAATKLLPAGDLVYNTNYQLRMQMGSANPQMLELEPGTELRDDIFYLSTRRQRSIEEPWDFKTDVTTAPPQELLAFLMYELCDLLAHETKDVYWVSAKADWGEHLGQEVKPRAELPYQPPREYVIVKI